MNSCSPTYKFTTTMITPNLQEVCKVEYIKAQSAASIHNYFVKKLAPSTMLASVFTLSAFLALALAKSITSTPTNEPCEIVVYTSQAYRSKCGDEGTISIVEQGKVHKSGNLFFCNIDKGKSDYSVECGRTCDKSFMDCDYMCRHKSASFWLGSHQKSYYLTAKCPNLPGQ